MSREMIDKWAEALPDRRTITAFWEWLEERVNRLEQSDSMAHLSIEQELDKYCEIDRKKLEDERRALIPDVTTLQHESEQT